MRVLLLVVALLVSGIGFSQVYDPERVNAKAVKTYEKALDVLSDGRMADAIPLLTQSIKEDSNFVDAYLSLAGALGELKKYEQAVRVYEKARSKDTAYFRIYSLPYSINLAGLGRFEKALLAVNYFLTYPKLNERSLKSAQYRKRSYEFAISYAAQHKDRRY